jgi:hypothetical protein
MQNSTGTVVFNAKLTGAKVFNAKLQRNYSLQCKTPQELFYITKLNTSGHRIFFSKEKISE